jgi:hypothetical protein
MLARFTFRRSRRRVPADVRGEEVVRRLVVVKAEVAALVVGICRLIFAEGAPRQNSMFAAHYWQKEKDEWMKLLTKI